MRGLRDSDKKLKIHGDHKKDQENIPQGEVQYYEDEELFKHLNTIFKQAAHHKNDQLAVPVDWKWWRAIYDGKFHELEPNATAFKATDKHNKHDENILWWFVNVFSAAMDRVPMPKVHLDAKAVLMSENPEEARQYKIGLQRELTRQYKKQVSQYRISMLNDYGTIGNAFINVIPDKDTNEIKVQRRSEATVFPDPTKSTLKECEETHCCFFEVLPLDEAQEKYGVKLKSEGGYFKLKGITIETDETIYTMDDTEGTQNTSDKEVPAVRVLTVYIKDNALRTYYEEDDDDTGEPEKIEKKTEKYPNGRILTIFPYQPNYKNYIIRDYPNQSDGLWVKHLANHPSSTKGIWGSSDGKAIESHIRYINQAISILPANLERVGMGFWNFSGEGIRTDTMAPGDDRGITPPSAGGYVHSSIPSSRVDYHTPELVSRSIIETIMFRIEQAKLILGISNAMEGQSDFSGQSGEYSKVMIAQSGNRMAPKIDTWGTFVQSIYQAMTHIITRFYPSNEKTAMIITENEGYNDQAGVLPEGDAPTAAPQGLEKVERSQYLVFMPELGEKYKPRIEVTREAVQPIDPNEELEQALALFKTGMESEYAKSFVDPEHIAELTTAIQDRERVIMYIEKLKRDNNVEQQLLMENEQLNQMIEELQNEIKQLQGNSEPGVELDEDEMQMFNPEIDPAQRREMMEAYQEVNPTRFAEILEGAPELAQDPVVMEMLSTA